MNEQQKQKIRQQFPDITDEELQQAESDPDSVASALSQRTGRPADEVRQALSATQ